MATKWPYQTRQVTVDRSSGGGLGLQIVHYGEPDMKGARIEEIRPGSNADKAQGFRKGDVILEVNTTNVLDASYDEVLAAIQEAGEVIGFTVAESTDVDNPKYSQAPMVEESSSSPVDPQEKYKTSVPFTTRPMREGETHGVNYNFVSREEFEGFIKAGLMSEHGEHKGNFYGSMKPKGAEEASVRELYAIMKAKSKKSMPICQDKHLDMMVSNFLAAVAESKDEMIAKCRSAVKDAVYEVTTAFTTRPMRPGEISGQNYHFVSKQEFKDKIARSEMLEYGEKNGNMYGTPKIFKKDVPEMTKVDDVKRRETMQEAVANGPTEASLGAILEKTGIDVKVEVGADKTPSEFLKTVDPKHAALGEIRNKIKAAIYDITVPLTTRPPREGEKNGVHYNFVSRADFLSYVKADQMLEWGEGNGGNLYGTLKISQDNLPSISKRASTTEAAEETVISEAKNEEPEQPAVASDDEPDGGYIQVGGLDTPSPEKRDSSTIWSESAV
eukprot:m.37469 g.37469  ORF g.37469 m.37469 type:complete len:499 (+) comp9319_c0_seq1:46-1542(+)